MVAVNSPPLARKEVIHLLLSKDYETAVLTVFCFIFFSELKIYLPFVLFFCFCVGVRADSTKELLQNDPYFLFYGLKRLIGKLMTTFTFGKFAKYV